MTSKQRWQFCVLSCIEAASDTLEKESKQVGDATRVKLQQIAAKCDRMKASMGPITAADSVAILDMHDRVCKALRVGDRSVKLLEWVYSSACMAADEAARLRTIKPQLADEFVFLEGMITEVIKDYDPDFESDEQMDLGISLAREITCAMVC